MTKLHPNPGMVNLAPGPGKGIDDAATKLAKEMIQHGTDFLRGTGQLPDDGADEVTIPTGEYAVVTSDGGANVELYIPADDDKALVPRLGAFLTACFMRADDTAFVDEVIGWFEAQHSADEAEGN